MTMNDPRSSPPRGPYSRDRSDATTIVVWVLVTLVAAIFLGTVISGMSNRATTATNPPTQTTGQGTQAPTPPAQSK